MSRSTESLTYPEALELLDSDDTDGTLRQAAADRIEMTVQDPAVDETIVRDVALDLLRIVHPDA